MEVTKVGKNTFITDSLEDRRSDAVFPIYEDESAFFAKHLAVRDGDRVLDIGTGSGVLAVSAADKAASVLATDGNSRALEFARFNAYMNDISNKVRFVRSNALAQVRGKFDLVLFNPPFNPAPKNMNVKKFSYGGDDGTELIRRVFSKLDRHIKRKGRLQIISFSLGNAGNALVIDLLHKYFGHRSIHIQVTHIYPPVLHKRIRYFEKIFGNMDRAWYRRLNAWPEAFYFFLTVQFDAQKAGITNRTLKKNFVVEKYSGSRVARIRRLRMIYRGV